MKTTINTYAALLSAIEKMEEKHSQSQLKLSVEIETLASSLNPVSIVQNSITGLATDKNVQQLAVRAGLTTASNLVIDAVLGKRKSVKGFLSAILVETLSTAFINSQLPSLLSGLSEALRKKGPKEF